ncbi:predicted protein [Postia placenta Mad-698-R]|uniref:Uncharacterized protein n=1 Tax=Postia placenta MAD-698-R-SB12 TaxID=670580 RepID=A0A1X6N3X5_9APHY|nr:hypothetical protein POSPLADRAFT_1045674 [Postia placenta MAD-698-R-SB12]EED85927.1 predicted protein [Postia placenta Mad-698-R]OSX63305.1 hypothetical protein POSPLADRAFT_1045674 [Postia placenta MAD-698-R-SB12]
MKCGGIRPAQDDDSAVSAGTVIEAGVPTILHSWSPQFHTCDVAHREARDHWRQIQLCPRAYKVTTMGTCSLPGTHSRPLPACASIFDPTSGASFSHDPLYTGILQHLQQAHVIPVDGSDTGILVLAYTWLVGGLELHVFVTRIFSHLDALNRPYTNPVHIGRSGVLCQIVARVLLVTQAVNDVQEEILSVYI